MLCPNTSQTIQIPTLLASTFPALCQGLERFLANQPTPTNVVLSKGLSSQGIMIGAERGRTKIILPWSSSQKIFADVSPQQRTRVFRLLPRILSGLFALSRLDYAVGITKELGSVAVSKTTHDDELAPPRRLAKLLGLAHEDSGTLHTLTAAIKLLTRLELKRTDHKGEDHYIKGLLKFKGRKTLRTKDLQGHRGGAWWIASLHPELLKLSRSRYIQIDEEAFTLHERDFNVYLRLKAEQHFRYNKEEAELPNSIRLPIKRLITDAGLEQTTLRGTARERRYLKLALKHLIDQALISSCCHKDDKHVLIHFSKPPILSQKPLETVHPVAHTPFKPHILLQPSLETLMKPGGSEGSSTSSIAYSNIFREKVSDHPLRGSENLLEEKSKEKRKKRRRKRPRRTKKRVKNE